MIHSHLDQFKLQLLCTTCSYKFAVHYFAIVKLLDHCCHNHYCELVEYPVSRGVAKEHFNDALRASNIKS